MNPNPQTPDEAVRDALDALKVCRPFFYSESDFQCALADKMKATFSNVRLEEKRRLKKNEPNKKFGDIDIVAEFNGAPVFIESKHKMKKVSQEMRDRGFQAGNNGVGDNRRYLFWKDVWRLELLDAGPEAVRGFALLLTNREKFWMEPIHELQHVPQKHKIPPQDIHRLCEKYKDGVQWIEWPQTDERGICKCAILEVRP